MRRIVFLFFLFSFLTLYACKKEVIESGESLEWKKLEYKADIIKKGKKKNKLQDILFLNEFYENFESLKIKKDISAKIFEYDISGLQISSGEGQRSKKHLELKGEELVISIKPDQLLMESEKLNIIEFEIDCTQDIEIRMFMVPQDRENPGNKKEWLGNFILHKSLPGKTGKKFRKVFLDFSQPFGWKKKKIARFNIKINSLEKKQIKVKLKNIRMLSHLTRLYEKIPAMEYFRFGGAARKRLKSVFLPVGSKTEYTVSTLSDEIVFMDGYLGSVDDRGISFKIFSGGKTILSKNELRQITHFKSKLIPKNGEIKLVFEVSGQSGGVGIIGNMSIYRPFKDKHNVVYYLIDALRADKLGIIDNLYEELFEDGAVFSNAYSNAVRTADSLPSLFSGKYKFTLVEKNEDVPFVSDKELLLAEYFKAKGYATAAFINNPWLDLSNSSQGFDEMYFCWNPVEEYSAFPSEEDYKGMKYGDMYDLLQSFVEANRQKPVFIYIHTNEPHIPYEPPLNMRTYSAETPAGLSEMLYEKFAKSPHKPNLEDPSPEQLKAVKDIYRDAVLKADDFFRDTMDILKEENILDKLSLLILTADHGERFYEHRSWIHGPPDIYNEVIRIPVMISGRDIKPGIFRENVQLLDIFPTIVDWMGDKPFEYFSGTSLLDYINDKEDWRHQRLIYSDGIGQRAQYAVIQGNIKVIINGNKVEVYDLEMDPKEKDNIASDPLYEELIQEAKSFQRRYKRSFQKKSRELSAEDIERLKTLGYIK